MIDEWIVGAWGVIEIDLLVIGSLFSDKTDNTEATLAENLYDLILGRCRGLALQVSNSGSFHDSSFS